MLKIITIKKNYKSFIVKILFFLIIKSYNLTFSFKEENFYNEIDYENLNFEQIEKLLLNEPITDIIDVPHFTNLHARVFKGLYSKFFEAFRKPYDYNQKIIDFFTVVERKACKIYLITFKNGMKAIFRVGRFNSYSELAAYKLCKFLGLKLVPPTVIRNINDQKGTLQLFINSEVSRSEYKLLFDKVLDKTKSDMKCFSFLLGHFDFSPEIAHNVVLVKLKNGEIRPFLFDFEYSTLIFKVFFIKDKLVIFVNFTVYDNLDSHKDSVPFPLVPLIIDKEKLNTLSKDSIEFKFKKILELAINSIKGKFLEYYVWNDSIWIKSPISLKAYKVYYKSTLDKIKKIDEKILEQIWIDSIENDPEITWYYRKIIDSIIERKYQILEEAKKGIIKDDEGNILQGNTKYF